jgi:hypothetical protein
MATIYFEITNYWVFLGGQHAKDHVATIQCHGERNDPGTFDQRLHIRFWTKSPPSNQSLISSSREIGTINLPESHYAWYLDLLRNEGGVAAHIDSQRPEYNGIYVADEPVGEGEL